MRVRTYLTGNYATLGPLWLQPPFTVTYKKKYFFLFYLKNIFLFHFNQHRAGIRFYTSFYNLAESCVFIKQSLPLVILKIIQFLNIIVLSPEVTEPFCRVPSIFLLRLP